MQMKQKKRATTAAEIRTKASNCGFHFNFGAVIINGLICGLTHIHVVSQPVLSASISLCVIS